MPLVRAINTAGIIVALSAAWFGVAHYYGWDAATVPNALAFGAVIYTGFRINH
jgi:hypothetical protein